MPGAKAKTDGFVDLFWPGMLLVEQKSRGKNLDAALTQALSYFPGIPERDLPQIVIVIVCDFARFRVHRLTTSETIEFALKDLHKHIKPLFLDELWAEFEKVKKNKNKLFEFHKRLRTDKPKKKQRTKTTVTE